MLACDGANAGALVVLEQKRVVAEWPATLEDYLGPITTLCRTAQIEALDALLGVMPVDLRNALLRDIKLCARCCLHNAHKALLFLVKRYGSVFIDESQEHAAEMCISLAYRAGSEDLLLAVLERTNFHNTQVRRFFLKFFFVLILSLLSHSLSLSLSSLSFSFSLSLSSLIIKRTACWV